MHPSQPREHCEDREHLRRPSHRPRRVGFTLIELLVTMGVIVILVGILFLGLRAMSNSGKADQTRVNLSNLQNMLAELDAATKLRGDVAVWAAHDSSGAVVAVDTATTHANWGLDFWRVHFKTAPAGTALGLVAPSDLDAENSPTADRDASFAIVNTSIAMGQLARIPANRTALEQMGSDVSYLLTWPKPKRTQVKAPGGNRVVEATDGNDDVRYVAGAIVKEGNAVYRCVGSGFVLSAPSSGTDWVAESKPAPLVLDGWNNPIIFVPASGLVVRLKGNANDYKSTGNITRVITSAGLYDPAVVTQIPANTRPFWASAGPDGVFWQGDDNLYSFEK